MDLNAFIARWTASGASERANKDTFLVELCDVLGVPHPDPKTGDRARDRYVFEADAVLSRPDGPETIGKIDLWREGAFLLEAKQGSDAGAAVLGTARRGTGGWVRAMGDAYGQALNYARTQAAPPPFLIVADIGYCFDLYACFDGTLAYRPFPDGQSSRVYLAKLADHVDLLRAIWTDPQSLDPARTKTRVTREIAGHVAELAARLQAPRGGAAGHDPELVAKFLMRCLFTMFAEDVGLLPTGVFTDALAEHWIPHPERFVDEVTDLWEKMNRGGTLFGAGRILRFNGGLFADARALPLDRAALETLHRAARCEWSDVEPAIFGTLLERALDARERHRLGAHYTPRAYVERLVRPTLEDPLRAEWDLARAEARQLLQAGKDAEARDVVGQFHKVLVGTKVLDPACGTGNFLYVALDTFKRLESEVLKLLEDLGDTQARFGPRVTPSQFLGIEKKPWAKEIAELVLWMGYLSWNARMSGKATAPREPVLADYGHIECRDAVLAWDAVEPVLDAEGRPVTRWDGESTKTHPVTGNEVPDDTRRVPVVRYVNPRAAAWPEADFVVGNPPFIGNKRMREALGDGYTEALRAAYPEVTSTADLVMYWWHKAAALLCDRKLQRFGFITTNSITQVFNRKVIEAHMGDEAGALALVWAVPDHPWVVDGAAVRIAMTVGDDAGEGHPPVLERVVREEERGGEAPEVTLDRREVGRIHADLRGGTAVAEALSANRGLAFRGITLCGTGFVIDRGEAARIGPVAKPYVNGRDLTQRSRDAWVIDLFGLDEDEVMRDHPEAFQRVLNEVKPERQHVERAIYREKWWVFAEARPALRRAVSGQARYIATPMTARHRIFTFLDAEVIPDQGLIAIALSDGWAAGVLSARVHLCWALASGGRLGVGNDARYNQSSCFECFPFPDPTPEQRARIADLGERLDKHRKDRQALHPDLTLTGMYNVLEKLRAGTPLTEKERAVHDKGLVSILKELHDALDVAVAEAYGWPADLDDEALLERLVALNAERAAEEKRGLVRWLRPEYQRPLAGEPAAENAPLPGLAADADAAPEAGAAPVGKAKWPATLSDRISAVRAAVLRAPGGVGVEDVARAFTKAPRKEVESILESLAALGIVASFGAGEARRWQPARAAA